MKASSLHGSSKPNEGLDDPLPSGALVFPVDVPLGPSSERVKSFEGEAKLEEGGGDGPEEPAPGMFIDPEVVEAGTSFESVGPSAEAGTSFESVGPGAVEAGA